MLSGGYPPRGEFTTSRRKHNLELVYFKWTQITHTNESKGNDRLNSHNKTKMLFIKGNTSSRQASIDSQYL